MKLSKKQKTIILATCLLTSIILFVLALYPEPPKVQEGTEIKLNDTDRDINIYEMIYPSENKVVSSSKNTSLPISDNFVNDTVNVIHEGSNNSTDSDEDKQLRKIQEEIRKKEELAKYIVGDAIEPAAQPMKKKKKKVEKKPEKKMQKNTALPNPTASVFNTVTLVENKKYNAIKAFVHSTQTVMVGSTLKMRLAEDAYTDDNILIKKNSPVYGLVTKIDGERVMIKITHVNVNGNILPFQKEVFSKDALPGIYVPGNEKSEAKNAITEGAVQAVELPTSGVAGIDAAGAITGNVINAAKQVAKKNIEKIKVTIKTNYQIFLMTPENKVDELSRLKQPSSSEESNEDEQE